MVVGTLGHCTIKSKEASNFKIFERGRCVPSFGHGCVVAVIREILNFTGRRSVGLWTRRAVEDAGEALRVNGNHRKPLRTQTLSVPSHMTNQAAEFLRQGTGSKVTELERLEETPALNILANDLSRSNKPFEFKMSFPEAPGYFNFATDVVDKWAIQEPALKAMLWSDGKQGPVKELTYQYFSTRSQQAAHLFTRLGAKRGDRMIILLPRVPAWYVSLVRG